MKVIGDVHGKFFAYWEKIKQSQYSIQLGDFGFASDWYRLIGNKINSDNHKIIPGNHEDYYGIRNEYTFGKDYGDVNWHGLNFFFVRGAYSVDYNLRTIGLSWWPQEELSYQEFNKAIDLYESKRPEIMLSHDGPGEIASTLNKRPYIKNRTGDALYRMFELHKPKIWIFSHWHYNTFETIDGTFFVVLDELSDIEYDTEKSVADNILLIEHQMIHKRKPLRW